MGERSLSLSLPRERERGGGLRRAGRAGKAPRPHLGMPLLRRRPFEPVRPGAAPAGGAAGGKVYVARATGEAFDNYACVHPPPPIHPFTPTPYTGLTQPTPSPGRRRCPA